VDPLLPPDRFDDIRREWIAFRQGDSLIQRRRAEVLGRVVRKRQRIRTAAVPDPHDDTVLPPLMFRQAKSLFSHFERALVLLAALVAPIGWPTGWALKTFIAKQIPHTLRGFPIAALLWSGAALGMLTIVVYQLTYDSAGSFGQIVVLPWVCVQLAAVPCVAGVYGIAEGWLAVEGSDQWWPLTPRQRPLTAADAAAILAAYDMTGPGVVDVRRLNQPGERTRP
jgi:hypothetical protein